jgi:hypothetical protein
MSEPLTPCVRRVLELLAREVEDSAGVNDYEITDYLASENDQKLVSPKDFVGGLMRDVWWHYGHVGDPEDKPEFQLTEDRLGLGLRRLIACRRQDDQDYELKRRYDKVFRDDPDGF